MDAGRGLGQRVVVPAARQVQQVAGLHQHLLPQPALGLFVLRLAGGLRKTGLAIGQSARPSQMFQVFSPSTCTAQTSCVS